MIGTQVGMQSEFAVDKLERELFQRLLSAEFKAGDQFPAYEKLSAEYGVGYQTVRGAVGRLVSRGLLMSEPGGGTVVVELLHSADLAVLVEIIHAAVDLERKFELTAQLLGFVKHNVSEIAERAALNRSTDHLEWLKFFIRSLQDRTSMNCPAEEVGSAEFQVLCAMASAAGNITWAVMLNGLRLWIRRLPGASGGRTLIPIEQWWELHSAITAQNVKRCTELIEESVGAVEQRYVDRLKAYGWTEKPMAVAEDT